VTFTPLPDLRGQFQLGDGVTGQVDFAAAPSEILVPLSDVRLVIIGVKLEATADAPIDTDVWRRVPLGYLTQLANLPENRRVITNTGDVKVVKARPASYRVKPPAERRYPDGFYGKVAAAYQRAVTEQQAPAQTIADVNDVPVTTVHRWTREARRRGFLQPARAKGQG
jgi:hypothetical protein